MAELQSKKKRLRGFPATFARRLDGLSEYENFKEFSKNLSIKLLLNPTDAKLAVLLNVEKGNLSVDGISNDNPENLKKKLLGWNGRMTTDIRTFMDYAAGKIGLGLLFKKILTRKVKVKGLLYFVLLEKLFTLTVENNEIQEPKLIRNINIKKSLIYSRLFFFTGFLHVVILILSIGIKNLVFTSLLFGFFAIWLGSMLSKLVKANVIAERPILISATTLTFLNIMTYATIILGGVAENRIYINYLILITIGLDIICFIFFFITKSRLENMDRDEKLNYFSIVIIRGLGIGLLFNLVGWIIPPNTNLIMIIFILIFGTLNMIYGSKLLFKADDLRIQIESLIALISGLIFAILIFVLVVPDPKSFVNILLFSLVIPIRLYYIERNFKKN